MGLRFRSYKTMIIVPDSQIEDDADGEPRYQNRCAYNALHRTYVISAHFLHGLEGITDSPEVEGPIHYGPWIDTEDPGPDPDFAYGEYNLVRDALSQAFLGCLASDVWKNPDLYRGKPMFDLIQFADNQGTLGPVACRRIADSFTEGGDDTFNRFCRHYDEGDPVSAAHAYYPLYFAALHAADTGVILIS